MTNDLQSLVDRVEGDPWVRPLWSRILAFIFGLFLFCGAAAVFGFMFEFVDAVRRSWPSWAIFATFPIWGLLILGILCAGGLFWGYALSDDPAPENN